MKIWGGIPAILVALVFVASSVGMPAERTPAGERVFQSKGCSQCHALRGEAGKPGPALERLRRDQTAGEFTARLWNHLPAMRLAARQHASTWPRMTSQDNGCLKCHALAGEGGTGGPDLSKYPDYTRSLAWAAAMWNHGPEMLDRSTQMGIPFPILAPEDMVDLLGFLAAYRQTHP